MAGFFIRTKTKEDADKIRNLLNILSAVSKVTNAIYLKSVLNKEARRLGISEVFKKI